jgi:hypothetical protein
MKSAITSYVKGTPSSGIGKYSYAMLSCGHSAALHYVRSRGTCCGCSAELTENDRGWFDPCACGKWSAAPTFSADKWNDAHIIEKIGDTVDCVTCDQYAAQIEKLRAMEVYSIHHARHNGRRGVSAGWELYRRDTSSPSGVLLAGYVPDTLEVEAIFREKHFATMSPTEGRGRV